MNTFRYLQYSSVKKQVVVWKNTQNHAGSSFVTLCVTARDVTLPRDWEGLPTPTNTTISYFTRPERIRLHRVDRISLRRSLRSLDLDLDPHLRQQPSTPSIPSADPTSLHGLLCVIAHCNNLWFTLGKLASGSEGAGILYQANFSETDIVQTTSMHHHPCLSLQRHLSEELITVGSLFESLCFTFDILVASNGVLLIRSTPRCYTSNVGRYISFVDMA
jgi:hypothetical protein